MPTQSRGFWVCDFCGLSCDTEEEAREHEATQCANRPPSHRTHPPPPPPAYRTAGGPPPPYGAPPHSSPTTMAPLSAAAGGPPPEMGGYHPGDMQHKMRCIPLMRPQEANNLPTDDGIACQSIELFTATQEHVAEFEAGRDGGPPVIVGQLGLRCVHCSRSPPSSTSAYSIVFPASLGSMASSVRMIADEHLRICSMAPPEVHATCDRAAKKRREPAGEEARNADERDRMALLDYCIGLCQQFGIINKQPPQTGIAYADMEAPPHHPAAETPAASRRGTTPYSHAHSFDRMGPPHSMDRMGYPTPGPPGSMLRHGHPGMAGPMGPGGDPLAPTPLQRRRDRQGGEAGERPPIYSADREGAPGGYPTPYSQGHPGGEMMYGGHESMGMQTPAQPNFEGSGPEGGTYPTPHSAHPSEASPGYQGSSQYDLPSNFPFYQEPDGSWHCKFCSGIHPQYRDPQSIWSTPSGGPPPGQFIDQHLNMCRSYHQSMPSPPLYQGPPPPYPPPYMAHQHMPYPGAWERSPPHAQMHPQHLHYPGPAAAGEPPYHYPPSHVESGHPGGPPRYDEQAPPGYPGSRPGAPPGPPVPPNYGMHGQPPPPPGMEGPGVVAGAQRKESIADSVRHAINYLIATDKDYLTLESREAKSSRLVLEEDRLLLTDYFFFLMKQLRLCRFSEADRKTRGGKREKIKLGYGGLQCVHCADVPNSRKFFWSNVDRLANSFAEIPGHVLKCRRCPQQTKDALMQLKQFHPEQMARLPRGSQKVFFRRMWRRLHDEDPVPPPEKAPTESNEENVAPQVSNTAETPKAPPTSVKAEEASPTTSKSDESVVVLQRSTQEAAQALAASTSQSEPLSPSSRILLAIPDDKEWLSDMDCFIRKQLEVFCATEEDVAMAQSDRKYPVHVGQVGIRCIHCSMSKKTASPQGTAVAFPFSISGIYESVREFQRLHLDTCENLSDATKSKLAGFKGSSSLSSVLRKYYVLAAKALGLQDTRDGIRSGAESVPLGSQAAFSFADGGSHATEDIRSSKQYTEQSVPKAAVAATSESKKRKEPSASTSSPPAEQPPSKTSKTSPSKGNAGGSTEV